MVLRLPLNNRAVQSFTGMEVVEKDPGSPPHSIAPGSRIISSKPDEVRVPSKKNVTDEIFPVFPQLEGLAQ